MSEKPESEAAGAPKSNKAVLAMAVLAALMLGAAGGMFMMLRRTGAPAPAPAAHGEGEAKAEGGEHGGGEHGGGEHGGGEHGEEHGGGEHGGGEHGEEHASSHDDGDDGPVVTLAPFVVNLLDEAGETHYLKCTIAVELAGSGHDKVLEARTPRLRNALLLYLGTLRVNDTDGIDNKRRLVDALRARAMEAVGGHHVRDVFLTEFVIQ